MSAQLNVALAVGQIEEAMGLIDGRARRDDSDRMLHAYEALVRARDLLLAKAHAAPAAVDNQGRDVGSDRLRIACPFALCGGWDGPKRGRCYTCGISLGDA